MRCFKRAERQVNAVIAHDVHENFEESGFAVAPAAIASEQAMLLDAARKRVPDSLLDVVNTLLIVVEDFFEEPLKARAFRVGIEHHRRELCNEVSLSCRAELSGCEVNNSVSETEEHRIAVPSLAVIADVWF